MQHAKKHNETTAVRQIILSTLAQHRFLASGILLSVCGAILTALVPPLVLGRIIDTLTLRTMPSLPLILLYFAMLALTGILESVREGLLTVCGQQITHALRSRLMAKFVRLSAEELNLQEPGAVVSRFVGDVDTVENLFTSGIISIFADACKILSILAVIWFRNKGLALIFLLLLPLLFAFTRHVQKNMLTAQIENRKAVSRASAHVPETLHNIRTIHVLGKERYMEQQYDRYIGDSYRAMERTNFYDAIYSPVILILNAIVVALVMLLSASGNPRVLTLFGMSAGTAVAVMNYISQIFSPVESLGMEIQTIQSAVAGIHRIQEFFGLPEKEPVEANASVSAASAKPETTNSHADIQAFPDAPFVEFRDVTFSYDGDKPILSHLNLTVETGDQLTLLGRTGAGKSTLFKLLLGLYQPDSGQVRIHGVPAASIPEAARRKLFGYVEQSFHMVPGTVRDQITLFDPAISDEAVQKAACLTGLADAISHLAQGYDTPCTPELFSQGQWQLLSIARAAVSDPELLLLDEITANLDAKTEQHVLRALRRVSENRTVLSISHRTSAEFGRTFTLHDNAVFPIK